MASCTNVILLVLRYKANRSLVEYLETENTLSSKRIKEEPEHDGSFIGDDAVNAEKVLTC